MDAIHTLVGTHNTHAGGLTAHMLVGTHTGTHAVNPWRLVPQLGALEENISQQLDSGEAADPEFWAAVLDSMHLAKAKARLREVHRLLLQEHTQRLRHAADRVDVREAMGWDREAQEDSEEVCCCRGGEGVCCCTGAGGQPGGVLL